MKNRCRKAPPYIALVILLLIFNVPFPVHRELSGILIQTKNLDFCEKVTVKLDGSYHLNCLTHDEYKGYFRISNDVLTLKKELLFPVAVGVGFDEAESDLEYNLKGENLSKAELERIMDDELKRYIGGRVLSKRFLRKVCIVVPSVESYDGGGMSWNYGDLSNGKCKVIVTGADTYEDAVGILTASYGDAIKLP